MTRPLWLIEADVFGAAADPLKAEIRRQGMAFHLVRYQSLFTGPISYVGGHPLADDECIVFYGSLPLMRHIQLHRRWLPGGWCSIDNLDCVTYYPHFRPFLLNQSHWILTGIGAIEQQDSLYARFGRGGAVFARPSGVHKLFTGRRLAFDDFATALAPTRYDPATLVVIAEPRRIGREWRCVVAEDRVIAASQYANCGSKQFSAGCPEEVRAFGAHELAEVQWRPDMLFVMDVCESDGNLFVVELNSFSCSGWYECDLRTIVATAGALAGTVWEREHALP